MSPQVTGSDLKQRPSKLHFAEYPVNAFAQAVGGGFHERGDFIDQFGGLGADDVSAEDLFVLGLDGQFYEAFSVKITIRRMPVQATINKNP